MLRARKWLSFHYSLRTLALLVFLFAAASAGIVQFKTFQEARKTELRRIDKELNVQGHRLEDVGYFLGEPRLSSGSPDWYYELLDRLSVNDVSSVWYERSLSNVEPAVLARISRSAEHVSLLNFDSIDDEAVRQTIGPRTTHLELTQSRCSENLLRDLELYSRIKDLRIRDAVIPADRLERVARLAQLETLVFPTHRDSLTTIPSLQCRGRLTQLHVVVYPDDIGSDDIFDDWKPAYFETMPPAPTMARHLQFLAGCNRLESLTFDGPLCTSAIQYIVTECPLLNAVEIRNSIIELEGMQAILSLRGLKVVTFENCHVTDEAISAAALAPGQVTGVRGNALLGNVAREYFERDEDSIFPSSSTMRSSDSCDAEPSSTHAKREG